ncbi:MAG: ATP synthase F1 subunit delta [Gemmatimonadota bacterium]
MSKAEGSTVARNYAETLLALARKAEDAPGWGNMLRQVAAAMNTDTTLHGFLESPRIASERKSEVLSKALGDRVPRVFMLFLHSLVKNRRQMLIPAIADEYDTLLDSSNGIVHARVTVSRETADDERDAIARRLSSIVGKTVVPHLEIDPTILGGVIVRIGDTVMDGSLRRRLSLLRRRIGVAGAR